MGQRLVKLKSWLGYSELFKEKAVSETDSKLGAHGVQNSLG